MFVRRTVRQIGDWLEDADAGGWALLVAGLMLFAVTALTPTLAELSAVQHRRDELAAHRHDIERAADRTERMIELVRDGDPLLLQRLAWRELRLQPTEAVLGQPIGRVLEPAPPKLTELPPPTPAAEPMIAADAKLRRWTQGRSGQAMLVGSVALMGLGLLTSFRRPAAG